MKQAYPAVIHEEDGRFWAEFPDIPGCFTDGDTITETLENAEEALGLHLAVLMDKDLPVPAASQLQDIVPEDGFTTMVLTNPYAYRKDNRAVKKTLSIPAWMNREAEKRHVNFSAVLQDALLAVIQ